MIVDIINKKRLGKVEMNSPVYDKIEDSKNTGRIIPIYPSTYKLSQTVLRKIIENGLHELDGKIDESLPSYLVDEYKLLDLNTAINQIHFPDTFVNVNGKVLITSDILASLLNAIPLTSLLY